MKLALIIGSLIVILICVITLAWLTRISTDPPAPAQERLGNTAYGASLIAFGFLCGVMAS